MQTYTSSSKTRGRRQNSYLTQYSHISGIRKQSSSLSVYRLERKPGHGRSGQKDSLRIMLDTLEDCTRPKSDEIAAFTQLRTPNQGNKTLSTYFQEVRRVVDMCNFYCVGAPKHINNVFQKAPVLL